MFYSEEETKQMMKSMFDSHMFWIFPMMTQTANDYVSAIEDRFYSGDRACGFNIVMLPNSPVGYILSIAFADKRFMSTEQLEELIGRDTMGRDLISMGTMSEDCFDKYLQVVLWLDKWMNDLEYSELFVTKHENGSITSDAWRSV